MLIGVSTDATWLQLEAARFTVSIGAEVGNRGIQRQQLPCAKLCTPTYDGEIGVNNSTSEGIPSS